MKAFYLTLVAVLGTAFSLHAQQGISINTTGASPDSSAMLDVSSTDKGILIPRLTQANRPSTPATGLMIYQADGAKGFYYYDGAAWKKMSTAAADTLTQDLYTNGYTITGDSTYGLVMGDNGQLRSSGVFGSGIDLPDPDAWTAHMIWYPKRASFRVGQVSGTQWHDANIGTHSFAAGYNTRASGNYGVAFGNGTTAANTSSFAAGEGSLASGAWSMALGYYAHTNARRGSFVFADNSSYPNNALDYFRAPASNTFNVRASGGYYFYSDSTATGANALIFKSGKLGIGMSSTPTEKLDVSGNIQASDTVKTTRFKMTGGATNGYVLTSDASGNASWATVNASVSSHTMSLSGNTLTSSVSGVVATAPAVSSHTLGISGNTLTSTVNGVSATASAVSSNALSLSGSSITSTVNGVASSALNISSVVTAAETDPQVSSATTSYVPRWTGTTLSDGAIYDNGTNIGIGTTTLTDKLNVNGSSTLAGTVTFNNSWNIQTGSDYYLEKSGTRFLTVYGTGGNVGIGTSNPGAKLDVDGNVKLGTNGTVLTSVIKATVSRDVASVSASSNGAETFSVSNAALGATVYLSPAGDLGSLVIGHARVSAAGTVTVKFVNPTGSAIDPALMDFYITVIN